MKNAEVEKIAEAIRAADTWDENLCKELCDAADMLDEWEAADGDTFESVIYKAAEKLGVEVL